MDRDGLFEQGQTDPYQPAPYDATAQQKASFGKVTRDDPWERMSDSPTNTQQATTPDKLDSQVMMKRHSTLLGHYHRELEVQAEQRARMAMDFDFYDGIQHSDADLMAMLERGQTPLTFNVIANTVNWMLGSQRRARSDYKILPRQKDAAAAAEKKTALTKYIADVNLSHYAESRAFAEAVIGGVGWLEDAVQPEDDGEPIYRRYESWRNMVADSAANELDLSDARYMFRTKWVDTDLAMAMFPERRAEVEIAADNLARGGNIGGAVVDQSGDDAMDSLEEHASSAGTGVSHNHSIGRERVRLIEAWYRAPSVDQYIRGGQFTGELYDSKSNGHVQEVILGRATVVRKTKMRMFVTIMTETGVLFHSKSPYRHNQFPFTPIFCYRRHRDLMPYGLVSQMRDPQIDVNRRAAKALHILNSNKVVMDEGAVADLGKFEREVSRPDAIIVKKPGKELVLDADRGLETSHLDMMSRSIALVQATTGVTDESMGRTTNANSGKAIIARQDQGSLATTPIFDNLRYARQISGSKQLSLIEQFMSQARQFRITNQRGTPEYIDINDGNEGNDIVSSKADFVISEDAFHATVRQAQVTALMDVVQQLATAAPQLAMQVLDLLVDSMDVPNREEIVKRIRSITGTSDPDEDPENPSPETLQRQQAQQEQQAMQQAMAEIEMRGKNAEIAVKEAQARKANADVERIMSELRRILAQTEGASVEAQAKAIAAATQLLGNPALGAIADDILDGAGYQDRTDTAQVANAMRATPDLPKPQMAAGPAPTPMIQQEPINA